VAKFSQDRSHQRICCNSRRWVAERRGATPDLAYAQSDALLAELGSIQLQLMLRRYRHLHAALVRAIAHLVVIDVLANGHGAIAPRPELVQIT